MKMSQLSFVHKKYIYHKTNVHTETSICGFAVMDVLYFINKINKTKHFCVNVFSMYIIEHIS